MRNFKVLISFLSCIVTSPFGTAASQSTEFARDLSPLSHTYVNDLLSHTRAIRSEANALPSDVSPFASRLSILPFAFDGIFLHPFVMLNMGLDMKGIPFLHSLIKDSLRGNLIVGHLYKYSPYLRVGYDFIPLGRHVFDTVVPRGSLTRFTLDQKQLTIEVGSSYCYLKNQLQGSIAFCEKNAAVILNAHYERKKPMQLLRFLRIDRYKVGGGIGRVIPYDDDNKKVYDLYSHIDFPKSYHFLFEYICDALFVKAKIGDTAVSSYCAFRTEVSKSFSEIPFTQLCVPWAVLCGYENASDKGCTFQQNFFGALKFEFWNRHLLFVIGSQWNVMENKKEKLLSILVSL